MQLRSTTGARGKGGSVLMIDEQRSQHTFAFVISPALCFGDCTTWDG